jgi:hypothetical protein
MKPAQSLNTEREAARALEAFLRGLPRFQLDNIEREGAVGHLDHHADIIADVQFAGKPLHLIVEVKSNGQPRVMRDTAAQLRRYLDAAQPNAIAIVMAPYLSEQARAACIDEGVGYLDFMGNAHIETDSIYIDRAVPGRPEPERRALRSLFKPKSARILRTLLKAPGRSWRTAELAEAAGVSAGLVSTVGSALRERGCAEQSEHGLVLTAPDDLLDLWSENYEPVRGEEVRLYSHLHGSALSERLRGLTMDEGRVALASFSAADWLAPFVRHPTTYFYADEAGLGALKRLLDAKPAEKGGNIVIVVPDEDGVLDDAEPVADGIVTTSPVQTYLDLMQTGDRGQEGAEHLRSALLGWRA